MDTNQKWWALKKMHQKTASKQWLGSNLGYLFVKVQGRDLGEQNTIKLIPWKIHGFEAKNGELEDDFPGDVNVPAVNFQRCNFKFGSLQYY